MYLVKEKSILSKIGNTPLAETFIGKDKVILAKLEFLNPGGSIKDRAALNMVEEAEKRGELLPGGTIVEASSGNQGIALAMIGSAKGYRVIITVKEKVSLEKQLAIKAYGAEVVVCSASTAQEDPENYHNKAMQIAESIPGSYMPNQHYNPDNADAYYTTLGPEIWKQTEGQITHFFAAAGTGGTINGTARFLKERNSEIKVIAIDAANSWRSTKGNPKPYGIEGMGVDYENDWLIDSLIDEYVTVTDDEAIEMVHILAKEHGFLVGGSSGAIAFGAQKFAPKMKFRDKAVIVFPDSGRAYLSKYYNNT